MAAGSAQPRRPDRERRAPREEAADGGLEGRRWSGGPARRRRRPRLRREARRWGSVRIWPPPRRGELGRGAGESSTVLPCCARVAVPHARRRGRGREVLPGWDGGAAGKEVEVPPQRRRGPAELECGLGLAGLERGGPDEVPPGGGRA